MERYHDEIIDRINSLIMKGAPQGKFAELVNFRSVSLAEDEAFTFQISGLEFKNNFVFTFRLMERLEITHLKVVSLLFFASLLQRLNYVISVFSFKHQRLRNIQFTEGFGKFAYSKQFLVIY